MLVDPMWLGIGAGALALAFYLVGYAHGATVEHKEARRLATEKTTELQARREREESRLAEVVPICRHAAAVPSCRTCGRRAS